MKRFVWFALLTLLLVAALAVAQSTPAKPATPAPAAAAPEAPPALSTDEQKDLKILDLESTVLEAQAWNTPGGHQIQDGYAQLYQKLNTEHPGYTFNPQFRAFIKSAAAAPTPAPAAAAPAKK